MIYTIITASFILSAVLTFVFRKIGIRYRFFDEPRGDVLKIHKEPIPYLGGAALFGVFLILFPLFSYYKGFWGLDVGLALFAGFLFFSLGLWDDIKWKHISTIRPGFKLVLLVVVSILVTVIFWEIGVSMSIVPWIGVSTFITFLYVLGLINAVNFQDGLDGLAGGVVAISLVGFVLLSLMIGDSIVFVVSLVCLGAILGFLMYNFPPAKIFMGDSGAYFLGFILAFLALSLSKPYNIQSFLGPVFIIGLPIFETGFTITRRLIKKTSPFLGDRDHAYDKMYKWTQSIHKTLLINYGLQVASVIIGLLIFLI